MSGPCDNPDCSVCQSIFGPYPDFVQEEVNKQTVSWWDTFKDRIAELEKERDEASDLYVETEYARARDVQRLEEEIAELNKLLRNVYEMDSLEWESAKAVIMQILASAARQGFAVKETEALAAFDKGQVYVSKLRAIISNLTGERDWWEATAIDAAEACERQYDENVNRIAAQGRAEVEAASFQQMLAEEKNKNKRLSFALRDAEAEIVEMKRPENRGIGDSDIVEALKELDYLRLQLKRAREYTGVEAYACPLCTYKDGVFVKRCSLHEALDSSEAALLEYHDLYEDYGTHAPNVLKLVKKERDEYKELLHRAILDLAPYLDFDNYIKLLRERDV